MAELTSASRVTLGCFEVGKHLYAIDVVQVREVVRWQASTPLPGAPSLIDGVVDLRGAVIPVVDLGVVFRGVATRASGDARIVVVEVEGLVMGLIVDAALEVLQVDAVALEDPPALTTQAGYDAVRAVLRRTDQGPILVLSLDHILESVYRSALPGREVA